MTDIHERLKEERLRLSLNQSEFGDAGGVKKDAQLKYESGKRTPDIEYLAKISQFGVDILYVITGMRGENIANGSMEMAYLRNCRALKTNEMKQAGLNLLVNLRTALGIELYPDQAADKTKNET